MTRYSYNTAVAIYRAKRAKKRQDIFRCSMYTIGKISAILAAVAYASGAITMDSPSLRFPVICMIVGTMATIVSLSTTRISCK